MYALYNRILLAAIALCAGAIYFVAWQQQPLDGDLTRTGGFSERQFGWHGVQEYFESPFLFRVAYSLDDLDGPYDVIVLGDSFTRRSGNSWASYVADWSGWKILGFHHRDISLQRLVSSEAFRKHPPAILVYQTVERHAARRLRQLEGLNVPGPRLAADRDPLALQPMHAQMISRERPERFESLNERLSVGMHILEVRLKSLVSDDPHARVLPLRKDAPKLFTSRAQDRILLLNDDFTLRQRWAGRVPEAVAGYRSAQRALAQSGILLILMVFPDKLTVYADYLQDPQWKGTSVIPELAQTISMPRLDMAYREALADGLVDVYAPNNTHTSSAGSRRAAATFLEYLKRSGAVAPESSFADTPSTEPPVGSDHAG